jgi:hypothetical protein
MTGKNRKALSYTFALIISLQHHLQVSSRYQCMLVFSWTNLYSLISKTRIRGLDAFIPTSTSTSDMVESSSATHESPPRNGHSRRGGLGFRWQQCGRMHSSLCLWDPSTAHLMSTIIWARRKVAGDVEGGPCDEIDTVALGEPERRRGMFTDLWVVENGRRWGWWKRPEVSKCITRRPTTLCKPGLLEMLLNLVSRKPGSDCIVGAGAWLRALTREPNKSWLHYTSLFSL